MSSKRQRDVLRIVHLLVAVVLVLYLYTPLETSAVLGVVVRVLAVPLLGVTGIVMWQMPRIRRFAKGRRGPASSTGPMTEASGGR